MCAVALSATCIGGFIMAYRRKMSSRHSRKSFSRGAGRVHKKNFTSTGAHYVMRGGIRL